MSWRWSGSVQPCRRTEELKDECNLRSLGCPVGFCGIASSLSVRGEVRSPGSFHFGGPSSDWVNKAQQLFTLYYSSCRLWTSSQSQLFHASQLVDHLSSTLNHLGISTLVIFYLWADWYRDLFQAFLWDRAIFEILASSYAVLHTPGELLCN